MTGYCSKTERVDLAGAGTVSLSVEIKTLNTRFFEVLCKLPSNLGHLELPITSLLQEKFIRGRVYATLRLVEGKESLEAITPSWGLLEQYINAADQIKEKYKITGDLTISDCLRLPDIFASLQRPLSQEDEKKILECVAQAGDIVVQMREQEGQRLEKDFQNVFDVCAEKIEQIDQLFRVAMDEQKKKLSDVMSAEQTDSVVIEDLQAALNKMDIHEEITRFQSHLTSIDDFLKKDEMRKGKRLEFMLQELLRETNTMSAKCPSYAVNTMCIDIKVELEKAREQIQNIV